MKNKRKQKIIISAIELSNLERKKIQKETETLVIMNTEIKLIHLHRSLRLNWDTVNDKSIENIPWGRVHNQIREPAKQITDMLLDVIARDLAVKIKP